MTAINYEYAGGYLSHSDPVSRILLYDDVSSPTSSMICLVDSPLSNAGSLSCHTFKIYNPKCDASSDISLSSDYVTRPAVDRARNNLRRCAVSIECGQKTPSVGKVAQELLDECLKEDLCSSRPSPVYPKRKSKASKISTSSVAIDDTDLFCISENSDQCGSCSKKSELTGDGNRPAGSNVPHSNNTTTPDNCAAEASTAQEPRRAPSILKNPARPCHVHCRTRRRKCHPHSWTTIKKPGLGETLTSKFHKFLDSGARLAGYYPYNCTKCECKRSDTLISSQQAEKAAPTPSPIPQVSSTHPDAGLELTCSGKFCTPEIVPIKNPSQCTRESKCSLPGVLNSNSKTRQTSEFGAEALNPQGTMVQRGCCDKYIVESPVCQDCKVKTLDMLSSAAERLNSKGSCESHGKTSTQSKHRRSISRKTSQESLKVTCECRANSPTRSKHRISKSQKTSQESLKMSCESCVECSPQSKHRKSKSRKTSQESLKVTCEYRANSPTRSKHRISKSQKASQESLKMSCESCAECSPQSKHRKSKSRKTSQESLKMSCESCVECSSPQSKRRNSKSHNRSEESLKVSCECHAKSPTHFKHRTSKSKKTSQESLNISCESCVKCSPQSKRRTSKSRKTSKESLTSGHDKSPTQSKHRKSKSHKTSQESLIISCDCHDKSPTQSKHRKSKSRKPSQESLIISCECHGKSPTHLKDQIAKQQKTSQESLKIKGPAHLKDRVSRSQKSSLESLKNTKSEPRIAVTPPRAEPLTSPKPGECELCVSTTKCSGGCAAKTPEPQIQTPEPQVTGPEHDKTNKSDPPISAAQPERKTGPEKNKVETPAHSRSTASISGAKSPEPIPKTITLTTCPGPAICKRRSKKCPSTCSTTLHSPSADSAPKSRTQSSGQSNATEPDLPTSEATNTSNIHTKNKIKKASSNQSKKQSTGTGPEKPKTEQRPLNNKQGTDSEQDTSIGTQTEKPDLSRSDAIHSGPALYKISGIKLQLVGFSESNAAVLHIHSNLSGEGFEANPSKPGDVVPQNSCCPCPRSARSLAAPNVQQRNAGTECECTPQQKTSANTSIGAEINMTTSACTPQQKTNANTSIGAEINRPTPDTLKGDTKMNQPALPSSKISKHSLDTGQEESLGGAPNVATTKKGSTSSIQGPLDKDGSKDRIKSKKSDNKYGTGTVAKPKKGGLTSCWPFSICFKPKKEASVGDEYKPRDDKAVNVSTNEDPISKQYYCETHRCETNQPLANTQGLPLVSSQSCCPNRSQPNKNRNMCLNACAKLGSTCQPQTSNSASMLSSVNTSHVNGSHVKNNPSTSMLNSRNHCPFQYSLFNNNQAASMTSSPNPSPNIQDSGLKKNPATSILSSTNICAFHGLEMNKNRVAPASGCPNPSCLNPGCPFQATKRCGDRCCSFQNSEISKSLLTSIKCCANSVCPFEDSLIINQNQMNIPNICCNFGDLSIKKQLEGPGCTNSIINNSENTTDCDKDSLTNRKKFQSPKDMKSASKDSIAEKIKNNSSSSKSVRCETTQYSCTYVNDGPKEVPVQRSLSQPIWCQCGANPIRSSGSAPSVDQPGSQQHPTSLLNPELDTSSFCIYCGQATLMLKNRGPVDKSQGPLPSAACRDTTCPNKQHSMPPYLQVEPAQPAAPAKNLAKKGSDVECMCAEFADQYNTKQVQAEGPKEYARGFMIDRQSGASGLQFSMIPRDPNRGNYMTQEGDTGTPRGGSAPQQGDTQVQCGDPKCPGYPKNSVSCECSLVASLQQFCQPNACPGRDYCLGPASKQNQTEFPCGDICAQKVSSRDSSVKESKKKVKPAKLPELTYGYTCLQQLTSRSSESISETPRSDSAKPAKRPKQLKVKGLPCVSICSIEPPKPSKKAKKAKTDIPCDNICLQKARRHGAGLTVTMSGSCSCSEQPAKPPKPKKLKKSEFSCGNICLQKLTFSTSSSRETISRSASITSAAQELKQPKKARKSKSPKASDLPCGNVCLEKLRSSSSSSSSFKRSTTKAAKPAKPPKLPKATGTCGSVDCIKPSKKSKQAKSSKKSKTPKTSDFTGNTLELGSSATSSAIYITSKLMTPTTSHSGKPPKAAKKPKLPKGAKFPCGNICFKKLKSSSNASRSAKQAKESTFSCNSICLQVTPFGSPLHSASSKSNSRIKVAKQAKPAKLPKSAKQSVEVCFEKLTPCGSTSSSAISKSSSKSNSEEPAKPTRSEKVDKQTKPQKAADFPCQQIYLQKLTSSSSATSSISTEKTEKPPNVPVFPCNSMCLQVTPCGSAYNSKNNSKTKVGTKTKPTKQPEVGDFPCGAICLQKLTPSGSASSFKKSQSSSKTPEKSPKTSKKAKQPKAADFPCGNICLQKQTSTSSLKSAGKSSKPAKPPKSPKQPKATDFPCGNICSEKLTPSGSASSLVKSKSSSSISKTAKIQKAGKQSNLPEFPCGDICSQKLTSSSSASSSAKSISSSKSAAKPAKAPKSAKQRKAADFPSGSASSLAKLKSSNKATKAKPTKPTKQPKSAKQPKATDFPCGNICMQKFTSISSASSSAKSLGSSKSAVKPAKLEKPPKPPKEGKPAKQPKAADFPCGNICKQKLTSNSSASSSTLSKSSSKTKPAKSAKQPKSADFPCGNICLQKLSPSNSESSSAKSSKTKVAKQVKSAQSPKNNVKTSTSVIFSATNKEIPPCGNAFSQTPPSGSAAKLKKVKPPKQPKPAKAGKGAKSSCVCPRTLTPCGSASSLTKTAEPTKPPKSSKTKAAKPICVCPPTVTSCASALSVTKSAKKGRPPKAGKGAKGQPTITPCGSSSSLTKTNKPPKSPKAEKISKSPCVCPPTITPCGSGSSLTKAAKSSKTKAGKLPKSTKAGKRSKSPCVCPPTLTPCGSGSSLIKTTKAPKSSKPGKRAKSPIITPSGSALNVAKSEKQSKSPKAGKGAKGQPAITPCGNVTSLTETTKPSKSPKAVKRSKSSCSCPPTLTPCGSALGITKKAKPPKSPKAKKGGKSPCVCPPTITPCESTRSLEKSANPPKSGKGEKTPPSSLTPCGSESSLKSPKSPKPPKLPKAKKGAKPPCLCPPTLSPCGSAQLTPSRPRTPVKLVKPNSYKGNQEGVISLEQYEKNKKKKKKTKLQNTDVCLPICEASCNDKSNKKQLPVIDCVAGSKSLKGVIVTCECPASEPKKSKKRDKWLGIFPCNRQCESPKSVVPCQCPASGSTTPKNANIANRPSDPKGGKRYIDCSVSYENGKPKSLRSMVPCECPATEPKSKSKLKKTFIECSLSSLCQLSKSKRKGMTCECHEATPKKKGRKVGTSGPIPGNQETRDPRSPGEDPVNQGIKVEIRKKMCPLFVNA